MPKNNVFINSDSRLNPFKANIPFLYQRFANVFFNLLTTKAPHHIETSQLICIANQLTGFYMMANIGL